MGKKDSSKIDDRDQQILRRLANIEHKIDSIEQTTAFTLRADADKHYDSVKKIFGKSRRRAQVYLAANGRRSVQEISKLLDMKSSNVSIELEALRGEGLLEVIDKDGHRAYWGQKPIDRTIRISHYLKSQFNLNDNGLPIK